MIPGSNILNLALTVIARQEFTYFAFVSRVLGPSGKYIPLYAAGVTAMGSVQPVPRNVYFHMGLDFQKSYFNFFVPQSVLDVSRDVSSDQFFFNGKNYQCLSNTPWYGIDGWNQVLCIEVPFQRFLQTRNWGFDQYHQTFDNGNFVGA